jgi:hypothetical protein
VKFLRVTGDDFIFHLGRREKKLLTEVLGLYPLIPVTHHCGGQSPDSEAVQSSRKLLEEALAEHRQESKRQLDMLLNEQGRFREIATGFQLALNVHQIESLLQVVNDVRVGCWLKIGSPDGKRGKRVRLTAENARYHLAMEICGFFEASLLDARRRL